MPRYLHPATSTIFMATGFGKWGMAAGAASAKLIADLIADVPNPYYSAVKVHYNPSISFEIVHNKFLPACLRPRV
jgi:glycine/D-amino acid oxidase-like deaminating enzyme